MELFQNRFVNRICHKELRPMLLFAIFAEGYPAAMDILCTDHLGAYIEKDQSTPGHTTSYILRRVVNGPCKVCASR